MSKSRGYFGIGIENVKNSINVGTLYRSAHAFGASFTFSTGNRVSLQASDTSKTYKHIPHYHYDHTGGFLENLPLECVLVGVEFAHVKARSLYKFVHPERAIYVLGAEDTGLSQEVLSACHLIVYVESTICLNVSTTASIVMYDRLCKQSQRQIFP